MAQSRSRVTYDGIATEGEQQPLAAFAKEIFRKGASKIAREALRTLAAGERAWPGTEVERAPQSERPKSKVAQRQKTTPARQSLPVIKDASPPPAESQPIVTKTAPSPSPQARPPRDVPRILLINPPRYQNIPVVRLHRGEYLYVQGNQVPAQDLAYFGAAARDIAHIEIIEANAEDLSQQQTLARIEKFRPELIVVKGVLNILSHDLEAAFAYKARHPHVKVVVCCRGSTGREQLILEEFPQLDGILRGEVDAYARDLAMHPDLVGIPGIATLGKATGHPIRVVEDLDEYPIPALDLMPPIWNGGNKGFALPYYGVPSGYFLLSARGCPYTCNYCMVGGIDGRPFRFRKRDPKNVAEEMKLIQKRYGIGNVYIYDEIFTMPGHGDKICSQWEKEGVRMEFVCEGKPDLVTKPMLETMAKNGCLAVYYGIESGDAGILQDIEKGHEIEHARNAIQMTKDVGILAGAYVMLGFANESARSYLRTAQFLLDTRPDLLRYDFLLPYPATVIFREMNEAGLIEFDRTQMDRHISRQYTPKAAFRSNFLGRRTLKLMEGLLTVAFRDDLMRSPVPISA